MADDGPRGIVNVSVTTVNGGKRFAPPSDKLKVGVAVVDGE